MPFVRGEIDSNNERSAYLLPSCFTQRIKGLSRINSQSIPLVVYGGRPIKLATRKYGTEMREYCNILCSRVTCFAFSNVTLLTWHVEKQLVVRVDEGKTVRGRNRQWGRVAAAAAGARGVSALHRSQPPSLLDDVCAPRPAPLPRAPRTLAPRPTAFTTPEPHTYSLPVSHQATSARLWTLSRHICQMVVIFTFHFLDFCIILSTAVDKRFSS